MMTFDGTKSLSTRQKSLGPGQPDYPLLPAALRGCVASSSDDIQYPLEVDYDYSAVKRMSFGPHSTWSDWEELLPPRHPKMTMPVGNTPLVDVSSLARKHAARRVLVKDESRNPTWSHKDRLNTFTVSAALYEQAQTLIVASSGNHGVSAAAMASRAGLNCIVLTMPEVSDAFREMILGYGAYPVYLRAEDRWPVMRLLQTFPGFYPVSNLTATHTGHPWGPEGYKTIAYEILRDLGGLTPAAVVVPTGYGEMLYGIYKGFREAEIIGAINRIPQLVAVEPAARGPLHQALAKGLPAVTVEARPTVQSGTATTVNSYRSVVAIEQSDGIAMVVTDEEALNAHRQLARQGLWQEVSSSAALAALNKIDSFDQDGPIVLIGCSTGLKEPTKPGDAQAISPDIDTLRRYLKTEFDFTI